MTTSARPSLPPRTAAARLIVVLRGERAAQYAPVLEALISIPASLNRAWPLISCC